MPTKRSLLSLVPLGSVLLVCSTAGSLRNQYLERQHSVITFAHWRINGHTCQPWLGGGPAFIWSTSTMVGIHPERQTFTAVSHAAFQVRRENMLESPSVLLPKTRKIAKCENPKAKGEKMTISRLSLELIGTCKCREGLTAQQSCDISVTLSHRWHYVYDYN